jgi:hypothetical protein
MTNYTPEELQRVRDEHERWLKTRPGVVGTGIGMNKSGQICLKVYSNGMSAETRNKILERLPNIPVSIEETGEIRKQTAPITPRASE